MTAAVDLLAPAPALTGRITIETVLLSANNGRLCYRVRALRLPDEVHPDSLALELAGFDADHDDVARLLHSTSWRYHGGAVVLTYVGLPDPSPERALPVSPRRLPYAADRLAPTLPGVTTDDVALHAIRHLAYLRRTDPLVAATAAASPELWGLIERLDPAVAGRLGQPSPAAPRR